MVESAPDIGIVGAGIAGTVLALALRDGGLPVRLYPVPDTGETSDPIIELTANGARVLHALGLKQELSGISLVPDFSTTRNARTGFLLSQRPLGAFSEARYGAPCYVVEYGQLVGMLLDRCREVGVTIEETTEVADVETAAGTLTLAGGRQVSHPAIAMTTQSGGGASLLEERSWQPAPATLIRATAVRPDRQRDHGRFITTWVFPAAFCIEKPLPERPDGAQPVDLKVIVRGEPGPAADPHALLTTTFARAHPTLGHLLDGTEQVTASAPGLGSPAEFWQAGRLALLGEPVHATPFWSDLGPCAAIEDAWVLSRMMERWEEEPHREFATYERFRRPRAGRLHRHAMSELKTLTLDRPAEMWRRNLVWSLTSRFLPEIAMEKLDWLYGYDCIRGFA